ncbi:hypothetical protein ANCCAN_27164 [Ancylostoma caninum]|uniref:Uncharacterized protein n=1 Tax=Ancylostoma caninum TaxID=29170 RepID=A0A368F4U9_ANCCA|nr:hypothetical protein ANCCAN_27164 [Ancylostoma caninum]
MDINVEDIPISTSFTEVCFESKSSTTI